ncbi:MAG TPA: hypothetical protein DCS67_11700 [Clostridiales bacterium UBA8960]|jgi:peptidoglycan/xylan/chitin deacetylase (PgdA/CDA1 family)|nr:hypothetical protein [Clostridiales bacterium UBA8960]
MLYKRLMVVGIICLAIISTGCSNNSILQFEIENSEIETQNESQINTSTESETEETASDEFSEAVESSENAIDLQVIKPNELGQIMVIMYHGLGQKNGDYVRTPDSFRADLELLYERGYRPISMEDYINNRIDIGPGLTPFVLTFDDGSQTNFNILDEDTKEIDPNCSLGIMLELNKKYPDFIPKGIFYLTGRVSFGQAHLVEYKLNYLNENGFEIGNHSYGHESFKNMNTSMIMESLGKNEQAILSIVPDVKIRSLSLPYGIRPNNESAYSALTFGQYGETQYEYTSIVNVGWRPEYPSIHQKFNPFSINRVNSGDDKFELAYWIEHFDQNPQNRYISDGFPNIVTIWETDLDKINLDVMGDLEIRTYILDETQMP